MTEPDAEAVMMNRICAVTRMAHLCVVSARLLASGAQFVQIDMWGGSEPGNTHLNLIERDPRAHILTPSNRSDAVLDCLRRCPRSHRDDPKTPFAARG